jgi:hypothetical protein
MWHKRALALIRRLATGGDKPHHGQNEHGRDNERHDDEQHPGVDADVAEEPWPYLR